MLLPRFKQVAKDISAALLGDGRVVDVALFRFLKDEWYDLEDNLVADPSTVQNLNAPRESKQWWRKPRSSTCFYHYQPLDLVIAINCSKVPRASTKQKYEVAIATCIKNTNHAFNASHDALTALKNKQEFDAEFGRLLTTLQSSNQKDKGTTQTVDQSSLHLIVFDIDHFKQINDSNGHLYGNQVLRVLAQRLEGAKKEILTKHAGLKIFETYRVGGEEFAVVIHGALTKGDAMGVANTLRELVCKKILPTDDEWGSQNNLTELDGINLPLVKEREVTISLGVSSLSAIASNETQKIAVQLYGQADTALYCAKNGGRNCACHFDDILQRHGRVLQHHLDTNIITISIGHNVGVKPGLGFLVFHPDFAGEKAFIFSDGRTHKAIGKYPRVPSALITAFHVDKEISFCELSEKFKDAKVIVGSWLEAVPTGVITPYIESSPLTAAGVVTSLIPKSVIETKLDKFDEWEDLFCAVFSVRNSLTVERDRGTAFLNRALARLYEAIEREFDTTHDRAQVGTAQIAIVGHCSKEELPEKLQRVIESAEKATNNLAIFRCGVIAPDAYKAPDEGGDKSNYSPKYALAYALYASSDDLEDENKIVSFSADTINQILYKYRRDGEYIKAGKTYDEALTYGINAAAVENQIAICGLLKEGSDYAFVEQHFRAAIAIADKNSFRCNLAMTYVAQKKYSDAYNEFKLGFDEENKLERNYWAAYSLTCHYSAQDELDFDTRKKIFSHLKDIPRDQWFFTDREEVKQIAATYEVAVN